MKSFVYGLIGLALLCVVLSIATKFSTQIGLIAGVGPTGYLTGAMVLLLFGANLGLLELLSKK